MLDDNIPADWLPVFTWPYFFYSQQREFINSDAWQTWFIGGNGTGKTLVKYWSDCAHMLGVHPKRVGTPPIKIKSLVPSFDNVEDVALDKLLEPQRVLFPTPPTDRQLSWIRLLEDSKALIDADVENGWILIGPLLPKSQLKKGKRGEYSKEHHGIELLNGSSVWWSTSEQGWMAQRGFECDILSLDEECDERVFDECKRGLRNAKGGGKIFAALTPPYQVGQGPTWTKEAILEASLNDPDIHVVNACMADNPAISEQFIERFSKGKTQRQIDVQVYGKYPSWGDLVHPDFQNRLWDPKKLDGHILPNDTPMPGYDEVSWLMAFDWHPSKPCAAVWGYQTDDGDVVFFDELNKEWAEGKEVVELANAFYDYEGHPHSGRRFRRWQDPSAKTEYKAIMRGFNAWDVFRKNGIVTSPGRNRNPEVGIDIVNQYLRGDQKNHPRVFFYERMQYTRQYLGNHYWKRTEDNPRGKPDPKWSDYPICVRYILGELGTSISKKKRNKWPVRSYDAIKPKKKTYDISGMM